MVMRGKSSFENKRIGSAYAILKIIAEFFFARAAIPLVQNVRLMSKRIFCCPKHLLLY